MNDNKKSSMVYEALSEIRQIETAFSMWSLSNKYARIPFLRFRFKDTNKDDVIYIRLNNIINCYSGKLEWSLLTRADTLNYVLMPKIFESFFGEHVRINIDEILSEFTEEEYHRIVDTAITDVPNLAGCIRNSFKIFNK